MQQNITIPGLYYGRRIIPQPLSVEIMQYLKNSKEWFHVGSSATSRRVLHYGYKYNYSSRNINDVAPAIPGSISKLIDLIRETNILPDDYILNQCIVNEYLPGQGISPHIDTLGYGEYICCFTLHGGAEMEFTQQTVAKGTSHNPVQVYTHPRSLYIMSSDARYKWYHQMRARKTDKVEGVNKARVTRYSLTFRYVPVIEDIMDE
jgi:alkylated DNA repair dioxygenase AlkB